jgi:hypothetical protein
MHGATFRRDTRIDAKPIAGDAVRSVRAALQGG